MLLVIILKHNDVLFLYGLCSVYKCNFCPLLMHVSDCWLLDLIVLQKCLHLLTFYIKRLVSRCRSHTSSLLERTSLFSFVALPYRGLCFRSVCLFVSPSLCLYVLDNSNSCSLEMINFRAFASPMRRGPPVGQIENATWINVSAEWHVRTNGFEGLGVEPTPTHTRNLLVSSSRAH